MYKASELRSKSRDELLKLISELKGKLLALRFESATGQLSETHLPSTTKKQIALIFTILKEQELGLEVVAKPATEKAAPVKKEVKKPAAKVAPKVEVKEEVKEEVKVEAAKVVEAPIDHNTTKKVTLKTNLEKVEGDHELAHKIQAIINELVVIKFSLDSDKKEELVLEELVALAKVSEGVKKPFDLVKVDFNELTEELIVDRLIDEVKIVKYIYDNEETRSQLVESEIDGLLAAAKSVKKPHTLEEAGVREIN